MRPDVKSWVVKAERDYRTALALHSMRKRDFFESAGFHAQQCLEKYVKALLTLRAISFHRIHDLTALLNMSAPADPPLAKFARLVAPLNRFAVAFRYPGVAPRKRDVARAIEVLRLLRSELRRRLGL